MRVLFALPGFHRYNRGAEIALISVANELAKTGNSVTLIGSGQRNNSLSYHFLHSGCLSRTSFERFPSIPILRNDCAYEELTFSPGLLMRYRPSDYDVTVTCSYPFTNWILRRKRFGGKRPPHVYITQNGDWPAYSGNSEYRFFGCEGLVCTNQDFFERNRTRWYSTLIPNGVDTDRFSPGMPEPQTFGLPTNRFLVLMVSALIPSKRVSLGIEVASRIPDAHLVIAGDGPLREMIDARGNDLLSGRFTRISVSPERMPSLYRSANVFLHLSKEESFGNVFVEAMACGVPIVAHESPRQRWILQNLAYLANTDDLGSIVEQVQLARHTGSGRREASVVRARDFTWKTIGAQYENFLQKVVLNSTRAND